MFDITTQDIKYLQGVGPQRASVLNKEAGIFTLHDLLYYYPYKYIDRSRLYYINEIDGDMPYIQLKGCVLSFETLGDGRQRRLVAHFSDGTGIVDLIWFQGIKYIMSKYKAHEEYVVFGKPTVFNGRFNIAHPDMEKSEDASYTAFGLRPYYNTTEKMKRTSLNSHAMEKLMINAFDLIKDKLPETLPQYIVEESHLISLDEALREIHFPKNADMLRKAQLRLKFEVAFLYSVEYFKI
jgi:RecG-like helicase